ncbi:MAG: glycosyltransferase family 4 protein [Clostridia bacterium]|nr:glycosyltransferase family 4 protein [Clostridia bacterium]
MKKVLFVAHVDSHIRHFHIPYMKYFHDQGYEVHVATSDDECEKFDYCDIKHKIDMERSPLKLNNLKAIKQMTKLYEDEKFDLVTCHTPMGGVVTRLAAKRFKKIIKRHNSHDIPSNEVWSMPQIIYTAHGFHFFKGAPIQYWLIYYNIEKWLSKYTDKLVTINKEDYDVATKKRFKAKKIYKIDGIGVDASKFNFVMSDDEKKKLRKELCIDKDDVVITYVAELITRKNQDMIIDVIKNICNGDYQSTPKIKLLLVGTGVLKEKYEKRIKELHLEDKIMLTGYRKDVPKLLKITDIAISCAKHEGLPFNLVEAQMSGLPCVATDVRGNNEVIEENKTGYLIPNFDVIKFANKLLKLINSESMRERMGKNALENSKKYKLSKALDEMKKIYND